MKIIVDTRLLTRGTTTGIPGYAKELLHELVAQNPHDSFVLFLNAFRKEDQREALWRDYKNVTVINKRIPNRLLSFFLRLTGGPTIEKLTNTQDAEVLWSPHLDLLTTTKTPHVVTVHDISFLHYPRFFSKQYHLWSWLQNQLEQAKRADHILAVSEYTKQDLVRNLGLPASKISVIYPGIRSHFCPLLQNNEALAQFKQKRNLTKPFFLFFGTLETRKNVAAVVLAFNEAKQDTRLKEYELVLAGRPGLGFSALRKQIAASPFADSIRLLHDIADDERLYLYNSARALVFPSFFEGFGFPPLEAQACGVPVVSSLRASLAEVLKESALEIDPWRPHSIATQLLRLETDADLRAAHIKMGLHNVRRFSWQSAAEQTMRALKEARINR